MDDNIIPADLSKITTYSIKERKNKVKVSEFASPIGNINSINDFLFSLPRILAGNDFLGLVDSICKAYNNSKPFIVMIGGHVIKCGLGPILISLIEKKILTGIAMNGSASIHDFEIALIGETSEDVGTNLVTGKFGMWEETGSLMNQAIKEGYNRGKGIGKVLGHKLKELKAPYSEYSVLFNAFNMDIPATVHVAIGTDIIHQHPEASGAAIGETSFMDFRTFITEVSELGNGGVLLNIGSAVVMPEVFLKALSIARNMGNDVVEFTTANMDMFQHYRPRENVLKRPTNTGGNGYAITGHHEIMVPLLANAVVEKLCI
ncbi:hypothetical protein GF312_16285 [Candidatus Poribacteria bacterium]|nr:hypothetical protein [Candidatus Poribacteria bacterium]